MAGDSGLLKWRAEVDQQLGIMSSEINGIKATLRDINQLVGKIFSTLDEIKGKQGPGFGQMLTIGLCGCGIIGAAAAAITTLVTSIISPQLTRLETTAEQQQVLLNALLNQEKDDYRRLKDAASAELERRLQRLEERLTWVPQVQTN